MKRTANKNIHITNPPTEFQGSNLKGVWDDMLYIIYSYHTAIYIYDCENNRWYENTNWYSVTTTKHKRLARPGAHSHIANPITPMPEQDIYRKINTI